MPKKLPQYVEKNLVRGYTYLSFRRGKGPRIRLPDDPDSQEFKLAYAAALAGEMAPTSPTLKRDLTGAIGALIVDYKTKGTFTSLRATSKKGYTRLETIRIEHGHRTVAGLTRERINTFILAPLADRPGAQLDTLKKLRVLVQHANGLHWLKGDPTAGIKRPTTKEIRAWTDAELAAFEARWPIGTKQGLPMSSCATSAPRVSTFMPLPGRKSTPTVSTTSGARVAWRSTVICRTSFALH